MSPSPPELPPSALLFGRLEAREVVIVREGRRILDRASLAVAPGEIATLEGASGSGKSTLLRVLATLVEPDAGLVLLDGAPALALPPQVFRRRVAYVAQLPLMLEGTVADNLAAGPALRKRFLAAATIDALLARVGLSSELRSREARHLSGGERQRAAIARALANEPEVLLLDEPTAALDPDAAARILELVRLLARQGLGVLVVTHVEADAAALGGARYRCEAGRIRAGGASS